MDDIVDRVEIDLKLNSNAIYYCNLKIEYNIINRTIIFPFLRQTYYVHVPCGYKKV